MYTILHLLVAFFVGAVTALKYDPAFVGYNLNENQDAVSPLDYSGTWANHTYFASPSNWRFPVYTVRSFFPGKVVRVVLTGDPAALPGQICEWRPLE